MVRRLVAICMTFVLVAGPSLCCCTTMHAAQPPQPAPGSVSSERTSPCCCKDRCPAKAEPGSATPQGVGGEPPHDRQPDKHQCPCKEKGSKQSFDKATPPVVSALDTVRLHTATLQFVFVTLTTTDAVDSDFDSGGGSSPPGHRLTSWRLLQAHHMLRC